MLKKVFFLIAILSILAATAFTDEQNPERPVDLSLEINMMLHLQFELEFFINDSMGIKGGFGISPIGITCFTYNALFVYHLNLPSEHFQLDIEAGLPLAYFDFIEGRYVDWDPIIDDPYSGFLPGAGVLVSCRFNEGQALGLRAGASVMFEHQLNTGWKKPGLMPVLALVYNF